MMRSFLPAAVLALCAVNASGQEGAPYVPRQAVADTIRVWGDEHMAGVCRRWAEGFRQFHPRAEFVFQLDGSGTAMPGIYHQVADLALLGRESDLTDDNGFFKSAGGYPPLQLELMNGSVDDPAKSGAPAVFVNRDNPLSRLTLAQLEAIFGDEHRRGPRNIRTWGDLGLGGEWKDQPITLYAPDAESEAGVNFTRAVLLESRKMNWEHLTELADGRQAVEALHTQRYGMAIANLRYADPAVKVLAIAAHEAAPYVVPSRKSVIDRSYPLARRTYAFVNRKPGQPIQPALREFLRYVLSLNGQRDIVLEGGYLPLSAGVLDTELKKVD